MRPFANPIWRFRAQSHPVARGNAWAPPTGRRERPACRAPLPGTTPQSLSRERGSIWGQLLIQGCRGVAQLVAHLLWEQEAGGSSPPSPTKKAQFKGGKAEQG